MSVIDTLFACLDQPPTGVTHEDVLAARDFVARIAAIQQLYAQVKVVVQPTQQLPLEPVLREYRGCHLELRSLEPNEPCGACGVAAGDHRQHPSNRKA